MEYNPYKFWMTMLYIWDLKNIVHLLQFDLNKIPITDNGEIEQWKPGGP